MATPLMPPPSPPSAQKMARGVTDQTGVNSTKVVTVHGARYKMRQADGPGPAGAGQEATDAARLGREGIGVMCLDVIGVPVDVYVDAVGTAETLFFIAGGVCFDEAHTAQLLFSLLRSPDLSAVLAGTAWGQRGATRQRVDEAFGRMAATLSGVGAPDQSMVHRWPTLHTHHKVSDFAQLAGLGALYGAAVNTQYDPEAREAPLRAKVSAQVALWVDPSASTDEVVLHRARVTDFEAGTPGAALTGFPGVRGDRSAAGDNAVGETTFAFEAALDPMWDPAPLPGQAEGAVEGAFDTWRTLVRDMVPGAQGEVVHGAWVRRGELSGAIDAVKARALALVDELYAALDPDAFGDAMAIRFPYHYKRLHLDDVEAAGRAERLRV